VIFGIGTDVLKVDRIERTYARFGEHFARRLLLDEEYRLFANAKRPVRFLAMRFAAKEAIVKALGTGFANGVWVRDVGMIPNELGQPQVVFSARGRAVCRKLGAGEGFLTLSDEGGLVVAVAVLMRAERPAARRPSRAKTAPGASAKSKGRAAPEAKRTKKAKSSPPAKTKRRTRVRA
jgi:holo-[acyl-carrier protein] synthase